MKILVCQAASLNNVLTEMSKSLARSLTECGAEVNLVPIASIDPVGAMARTITETQSDWVVSFGSQGAEFQTNEGQSIYDVAACGFVGWDVDHPAYQFKRFNAPIRRRVQINASPSHSQFSELIGCNAKALPMLPGVDAVVADRLQLEERPILATAVMTWLGEPNDWWSQAKGTMVFRLVEGVVGRLLADERADVLSAYQSTLDDIGVNFPIDESMSNIIANIGLFVRQYDRLNFATNLVKMGLPCVICGNGWRDRLGEASHVTYIDNLDVADLWQLYKKSRVAFNLNAANGASERAVMAMASGAAVISDYGPLLQTQFGDQEAIRFFDRSKPATIMDALLSVLGSGDGQRIADCGYQSISKEHLWSHRAAQMLRGIGRVSTI